MTYPWNLLISTTQGGLVFRRSTGLYLVDIITFFIFYFLFYQYIVLFGLVQNIISILIYDLVIQIYQRPENSE